MPTSAKKISKQLINDLEPGESDVFVRDPILKGYGLKVTPNGTISYFLEYRLGGRGAPKGRISIGRHGSPWTPDSARKRAEELLELVKRGINPSTYKEEQNRLAVDLAFRKYADEFVEKYAKRRQVRSWQQAKRVLDRDIKPVLKNKPIHEITRGDVKRLLEDMADRAPGMARYAHAILRKLFRWAVDRGDIDRSPIADMVPPAPATSRERVLNDEELREVWQASDELKFPFGPMVRLLIATGQRREEVASLRRSELDLDSGIWMIPSERAKNGKAHLVPLNNLAREVIEAVPTLDASPDAMLFSTTGKTSPSGWSKAKARLDGIILENRQKRAEKLGQDPGAVPPIEPWRIHDLRRTLATGMQRLGVRLEVTEAVLNHVSGSRAGIVGVYQRHSWADEKRAALAAWGAMLAELSGAGVNSATNVVPLIRA